MPSSSRVALVVVAVVAVVLLLAIVEDRRQQPYLGCLAQQLQWTPIYPSSNQVDLWTINSTGCQCPEYDFWNDKCACCVSKGACPCGAKLPSKCTQCGLQQTCANPCNVTLDYRTLLQKSGVTYGTVTAPVTTGRTYCWYKFKSAPRRRIEIQIYKVYRLGLFKHSRCVDGYLQVEDGWNVDLSSADAPSGSRICGQHSHFLPPIVFFHERNRAVLKFFTQASTNDSQFVAFFNFPSKDDKTVGERQKGGSYVQFTDCDWVFHDHNCEEEHASCTMTSPGYPGVYPADKRCRYLITSSLPYTKIRIGFMSISLPDNQCDSTYIRVYAGRTTSSPVLKTICGGDDDDVSDGPSLPVLQTTSPSLLLEFSSSSTLPPPYRFSGFYSYLHFSTATVEEFSRLVDTPLINKLQESKGPLDSVLPDKNRDSHCDWTFRAGQVRTGYVDASRLTWYATNATCTITFRGRTNDQVEIMLLNYNLRGKYCAQSIEILEKSGADGAKERRLDKICGPEVSRSRTYGGNFASRKTYVTSGRVMVVKLTLTSPISPSLMQAVYKFHDKAAHGTRIEGTVCDVVVSGKGDTAGRLVNAASDDLFYWNVDGAFICKYYFSPSVKQIVTVTINRTIRNRKILQTNVTGGTGDEHCFTACDDNDGREGHCRCSTSRLTSVDMVDHVMYSDGDDLVYCSCGPTISSTVDYLVVSNTLGHFVHNIAHYAWNQPITGFHLQYTFYSAKACPDMRLESAGRLVVDLAELLTTYRNKISKERRHQQHTVHYVCEWTVDVDKFSSSASTFYVSFKSTEGSCTKLNLFVVVQQDGSSDDTKNSNVCPGQVNMAVNVSDAARLLYIKLKVLGRFSETYNGQITVSDEVLHVDKHLKTRFSLSTCAGRITSNLAFVTLIITKVAWDQT